MAARRCLSLPLSRSLLREDCASVVCLTRIYLPSRICSLLRLNRERGVVVEASLLLVRGYEQQKVTKKESREFIRTGKRFLAVHKNWETALIRALRAMPEGDEKDQMQVTEMAGEREGGGGRDCSVRNLRQAVERRLGLPNGNRFELLLYFFQMIVSSHRQERATDRTTTGDLSSDGGRLCVGRVLTYPVSLLCRD